MSDPLQFSVGFGKQPANPRQLREQPLRILYMTDLGATCRSRTDFPLASRPVHQIDIDTFNGLFEREQPVVRVPAGEVRLNELEDLHPEHLCKTLDIFSRLEDLCSRLRVPSTFEAASEEVQALLHPSPETPQATEAEGDADTLARLLGRPPASSPTGTASKESGDFLDALTQKAVQGHIVADADPRAELYVRAVEAAATAHMRTTLHDPAFQTIEAAWRGLHLLVSNIETDSDLSLHVWNVGKSELVEALGAADAGPEQSALHQRLIAERQDAPFNLIVSDVVFGQDSADLRLLATLGAMAGRSGAAVVAGVAPELIGAPSWEAIAADPTATHEPDPGWAALCASGIGHHILALAPRFLMRSPYGKGLDPADVFFKFEELEHPGDKKAPLLWGASSLLATVLIAQSFRQDGWSANINAHRVFDGLPHVPYHADGEAFVRPCAETLLSETATEAILQAGPCPVMAVRNRNEVHVSRFQSIAGDGRIGPFGG